MKVCTRCKLTKNIQEFNFKVKLKDLRHAHCKTCSRQYVKEHYNKNKAYYLRKAHKNNSSIRTKVRQYLWSYLGKNSCIDCGEKDIVVLEFDHIENKFMEIGKMVSGRYSLKKVIKEVEKCEIRCANCHRRKTAIQQGWHKNSLPL